MGELSGYPWAHLTERLWKRFCCYVHVDVDGPLFRGEPCHIWKGGRSKGGGKGENDADYTSFRVGKWTVRAHIFVCVREGRMIPGHHVDHACENTRCVNGRHLDVTTPTENVLRRWGKPREEAA